MKPKHSNLLKWAAWGAFIGLAGTAARADYTVLVGGLVGASGLAGKFIGGAVGGSFLGSIAAFVRNLFVR